MGKITFQEIKDMDAEYVANAQQIYGAYEFVQSGYVEKSFFALYMKQLRLCKKYPGIAFEISFSKVESEGAYKRLEKRKNVGRKRTVIIGKKAEPHVHGIVVAVEKGADIRSYQDELNKYLSKLAKKNTEIKQHKSKDIEADERMNITSGVGCYAKYCRKQAQSTRRGGAEYDWDYFNDERFFIP